jgi:hypothetical protein
MLSAVFITPLVTKLKFTFPPKSQASMLAEYLLSVMFVNTMQGRQPFETSEVFRKRVVHAFTIQSLMGPGWKKGRGIASVADHQVFAPFCQNKFSYYLSLI